MSKECCSNCKFSVDAVEDDSKISCVRYPPKVALMQTQNPITQEVNAHVTALPVQAMSDYWCGEYKVADKKPTLASV